MIKSEIKGFLKDMRQVQDEMNGEKFLTKNDAQNLYVKITVGTSQPTTGVWLDTTDYQS